MIRVPGRSLSCTPKSPGVRRAVHKGRTVICTPDMPDSPFLGWEDDGPNQAHLRSLRVTVAGAGDQGSSGTWSGEPRTIGA